MRDFGRCEERVCHPTIVREEKSRKFVIRNPGRVAVRVIRIDGCVITEGPRCDWLFVPAGDPTEIYVELKGSAVRRGIEQIEATIPQVSEDARGLVKHCYIVSRRVPKVQTDVQLAKAHFRQAYSAVLTVKSREAEHDLSATRPKKR